MSMTRFLVWLFPVSTLIQGAGGVSGHVYPHKPIRIVTSCVFSKRRRQENGS